MLAPLYSDWLKAAERLGSGVAVSADARLIAMPPTPEGIVIRHLSDGSIEVAAFQASGGAFHRVAFSPNGTLLAAINAQGTACIWHAPLISSIDGGSRALAELPR